MSLGSKLQPISVLYGKNEFLRREALDWVVRRELGDGDPAVNLRRFAGADAGAAEVLDEVRTYTLLGGRRVAIVDGADKFITAHRARLEKYAASPSDCGCLILICDTFRSGTRFYKAVKKVGELIECKPASGRALVTWLMNRCKSAYGKRLSYQAAACLQEHAGASQEGLDSELAKLTVYVGDRPEITRDDIESLVGRYREQKVFAVMDAVAEGDAARALREWHQVLSTDRAASGRSIGGLAWAVRGLLDSRKRLDAGESLHKLAHANWTDVDVFARRMERTSIRTCEDLLSDLLAADLEAKAGLADFAGGIEKFIVRHSLAARQ